MAMSKRAAGSGAAGLRWALPGVVCALLLYSPLMAAGLVWDDKFVQIAQLPYFRSIRDAFLFPADPAAVQHVFYRPAIWLSYMFDRAVSPPALVASVAHSMNILYHALAVFLVFLLGREVFSCVRRGDLAAGTAALFFAVNPSSMESVANIAGRTDTIATIFTLVSMLIGARWLQGGGGGGAANLRYAAPAALAWLLALLSKEVAVAALVLYPALFLFLASAGKTTRSRSDYFWYCAPFAATFALYLIGRGAAAVHAPQLPTLSGAEYPARLVAALGYYLRKAFVPWPQLTVVRELDPLAQAAAVLLVFLALCACLLWRGGAVRRFTFFVCAWFFAAIAPSLFSAFIPDVMTPVSERYLYLPSVAVALVFGWFAGNVSLPERFRLAAPALLAAVALSWAVTVAARVGDWKSDRSFWEAAASNPVSGQQSYVWINLGVALQMQDDWGGAVQAFRRARGLAKLKYEVTNSLFYLGTALVNFADVKPAAEKMALATEAAESLERHLAMEKRKSIYATLALAHLQRVEAEYGLTGKVNRQGAERAAYYARQSLATEPAETRASATLSRAMALVSLAKP